MKLLLKIVNGMKFGEKMVLVFFIGMYLGGLSKMLNVMNWDFLELKLKRIDCIEMRWIDLVLFWVGYFIGILIFVLLDMVVVKKLFMKCKLDFVK